VPIISANVIACQELLTETTGIFSAIRILSLLNVTRSTTHVNMHSLATVFSTPGDYAEHVMSVRMMTHEGLQIAVGEDYPFSFGYNADPEGYGGFSLQTRFNLELAKLPSGLGWFFVWVYVDGEPAAKTNFMLRWS
jgi:hypothetical protein